MARLDKFFGDRLYKSSAVAEVGDRLFTMYMRRKVGAVVSLGGGAGFQSDTT